MWSAFYMGNDEYEAWEQNSKPHTQISLCRESVHREICVFQAFYDIQTKWLWCNWTLKDWEENEAQLGVLMFTLWKITEAETTVFCLNGWFLLFIVFFPFFFNLQVIEMVNV